MDWVDRFGNNPRKGADILVQALEREGVDQMFAYPGGASMEIHQALTRSENIVNYLCRHEQVWMESMKRASACGLVACYAFWGIFAPSEKHIVPPCQHVSIAMHSRASVWPTIS